MPSIDWYLDEARARAAIPSDNALSRRLGFQNQAVNHWRLRRAWPSDDAMMALAELAGVDPAKALLDLNTWRCKSERVRDSYLALIAKISAAGILAYALSTTLPPAANASRTDQPRISQYYALCVIITAL